MGGRQPAASSWRLLLVGMAFHLGLQSAVAQDTAKGPWLAYEGSKFSVVFVGGVLLDGTVYSQDQASLAQVGDLQPLESAEVRAVRFGVAGLIKFKQPWSYVVAGAYRAFDQGFNTDTSATFTLFDLALGIPIAPVGLLTVGKMKEPFSQHRLMSLAWQQFMERSVGLDALLPARNVGVTLSNTALDSRATWSAGYFNSWLETNVSFGESSQQIIGRVTGLPIAGPEGASLVHFGLSGRYSDTRLGFVQFRASPEAFFAPSFVDTDTVPADGAVWLGLEGAWRKGPFWIQGEYVGTWVNAPAGADPRFHAAFVSAGWIVTGETRGYDRGRGVFRRLAPRRKATAGGLGLWEIVARYSRVDLTDQSVQGGELDRVSVGVNWYPTADSRVAVTYGRATLDRFGLVGHTHIFQLRLQLLIG